MNDASRRIFGLVLGLFMGLAYGLVANLINPLYLSGIPLHNSGNGPIASILLAGVAGGIIGMIAVWPEDVLPGLIFGSLAGALLTTLMSLRGMRGGIDFFMGLFVLLVMTFLPRAFLFLPIAGIVRWVSSVWSSELESISFSIAFKLVVICLLLISILLYVAFSYRLPWADVFTEPNWRP